MNKDRILLLANTIEEHAKKKEGLRGVGFNMLRYVSRIDGAKDLADHIDGCGTVACMAGWACLLEGPYTDAEGLLCKYDIYHTARKYLDLTFGEADTLFEPSLSAGPDWPGLIHITPRQAVRVLRHLAKTGKVDWSKRGRP